jgi:hypothetical protein
MPCILPYYSLVDDRVCHVRAFPVLDVQTVAPASLHNPIGEGKVPCCLLISLLLTPASGFPAMELRTGLSSMHGAAYITRLSRPGRVPCRSRRSQSPEPAFAFWLPHRVIRFPSEIFVVLLHDQLDALDSVVVDVDFVLQ